MHKYLFLLIITTILVNCNSGLICVFENKKVRVYNNTAFEITIFIDDNLNLIPIDKMNSFEHKFLDIPHSVLLKAGNSQFLRHLFIDPCMADFELIVED